MTPVHFAWTASEGRFLPFEHILLLNRKLVDVAAGRINRLMIWMPPRHGKSETTSKYFPAWYLGKFPDRRVILTSYEADFAASWGRKVRDLLVEWGPELFGVSINPLSSAANRWDLEGHDGGMITAGAGGSITGKGAHLLLIDDPVKNDQQAMSPTYRESLWDWYRATASTRLQKGGAIIIIQTRWHEDDLSGRLVQAMSEGGDQWEILNLPALAEDQQDILGRSPGEALCADLFDAPTLEQTKRRIGSYWFNSLYQQRPAPMEGGILKRGWWQFYRVAPTYYDELLQTWDMAFKDADAAKGGRPDYVVGQVWGRVGANKYLLDQVRGVMGFPETCMAVRALSAKWPDTTLKLVEDKANGPAVIATLKREISGLVAVEPLGGKVARAQAVSPQIEAGNIWLPDPAIAHWIGDFVEEASAFPNGTNDDQVDAMTQALLRFAAGGLQIFL